MGRERVLGILGVVLIVGGCAGQAVVSRPVEVRVPVAVRPELPASLRGPVVTGPLPEFVDPNTRDASVALTPEGVRRLRELLYVLKSAIVERNAVLGIER